MYAANIFVYGQDGSVDDYLKSLDKEIANREKYTDAKMSRIIGLRNRLASTDDTSERLQLIMNLGDAYNAFNNDSAMVYYSKGYENAIKANLANYANIFRLKRATCLSLAGFISESVKEYDAVDTLALSPQQLPEYYEQGRQLYSYVSSTYRKYPEIYKSWKAKSDSLRDIYLSITDQKLPQYQLNYGEALYDQGKLSQAKSFLIDILSQLDDDSNLYARACHIIAQIEMDQGNDDEAIKYLALSAMADIRGAVREVMSLQELGVIMSERGDIDRAYDYLSVALSNAVECQAALRMMQTSAALPLIQMAHNEQIASWRTKIYIVIIILVVLLLALGLLIFFLHRQMKKMKLLQDHLRSANQVKEIYISQFFRLCSIYIDKLNQFCKLANRKISSGNIDDLYKMTKSGKLVEEQSEEFYKLFDDAFLHIYPTFVNDVNNLLREKIVLKDGELLNNDLRILAFLRMGLEDTTQVAQILNYSVNTIYAYRNKLRNRAYDRENFESNIMKISSV